MIVVANFMTQQNAKKYEVLLAIVSACLTTSSGFKDFLTSGIANFASFRVSCLVETSENTKMP
jgi:hypothetical protein